MSRNATKRRSEVEPLEAQTNHQETYELSECYEPQPTTIDTL
jgi:hypothetical protein